jgi:hypothetical protein
MLYEILLQTTSQTSFRGFKQPTIKKLLQTNSKTTMSSNMFAGLAVDAEIDAELSEFVIVDGWKTCEGSRCGVMTPEFCECDGAGFDPAYDAVVEPVAELAPVADPTPVADPAPVAATAAQARRFITLQARNPTLGGILMAEAKKMFPNPEDSKFPTPIRVTFDPRMGYFITAYATTAEAADEMLRKFNTSVQLYVAHRDTYVNVTNVKAETIDGFFREKNYRKVGPFTFNLSETDEGLFIQMNRDKVGMLSYPTAEQEFWSIHHFLTLLNSTSDDVHILNVLRKISPEIDAAMEERKAAFKERNAAFKERKAAFKERNAAFKKQDYGARGAAFSADGQRSRPATLADFFANFEIAPAKGGKKNKNKKN